MKAVVIALVVAATVALSTCFPFKRLTKKTLERGRNVPTASHCIRHVEQLKPPEVAFKKSRQTVSQASSVNSKIVTIYITEKKIIEKMTIMLQN